MIEEEIRAEWQYYKLFYARMTELTLIAPDVGIFLSTAFWSVQSLLIGMGLTQADETTAMQVEYRTGPSHSLEYLKIWSSTTRGYWNLVCEYWMQSGSGHESGATFSGSEYSGDFTWMLDAIMQHQGAFRPGSTDFVEGLVQINRPTDRDLASAQTDMTGALDRIGSHLR